MEKLFLPDIVTSGGVFNTILASGSAGRLVSCDGCGKMASVVKYDALAMARGGWSKVDAMTMLAIT